MSESITPTELLAAVLDGIRMPLVFVEAALDHQDLAKRSLMVHNNPVEALGLVAGGIAMGGRSMARILVETAERVPQSGSPITRNLTKTEL